MLCQKCNAQNQNDAVFCTKCGARLFDENYNSEETDEILYRWSKENKGLDETGKTSKPENEPPSKNLDYVFRSITVKVILIGLLIFAAIVSITVFVTSPDKKHDSEKVNINNSIQDNNGRWNNTIKRTIDNITYRIPDNYTQKTEIGDNTFFDYDWGEIAVKKTNIDSRDGYLTYKVDSSDGTVMFGIKSDDEESDMEILKSKINITYITTAPPKTTATTTTPKTTTTTATPKMPYNMGEEITITSTVDRISDESKTIYVIADNVTWSINCEKVEGFNKLTAQCKNKTVKFIGNVSDDFEITLTSVIIGNQTYKTTDFSLYPIVYEDENVKIQYYEVGSYMGRYDSVIFRVTNKRDFQITIQCDSISLDGIQIDGNPTMSDEVAPKSTAKVYAKYHDGVENKSPTKISGNLRVIDFDYNNKHFDSYDATFVNIAI